jgi:hypothetical protein
MRPIKVALANVETTVGAVRANAERSAGREPTEITRQNIQAHPRGRARKFVTFFTRSIYKWVQSPITLHVGSLDLERERALQLPVVERDEWSG